MNIFSNKLKISAAISLMAFSVLLFAVPAGLNFTNSHTVIVSQAHAQTPPPAQTTQAPANASAKDFLGLTPVGQSGLVVEAILYFIQAILYSLISLAGLFFGIAVQFNLDLLQPANNVAVSVGWDIFRVITNLGFVLGIIVIAIGTIVRSRSYRAQQILWRLIVAALLVNFSLVIAGGILQVSDSLTGYFLSSLTGTQQYNFAGVSVVDNNPNNLVMKALVGNVVGFFQLPNVVVPQDGSGWFKAEFLKVANVISHITLGPTILELFSLTLTVIVFLIVFLTLLVLFLQVFVRYFFITALLIVSPIVWLMWIFPFGKRWWRDWWLHFIKWTFVLPLNLFFLWLAVSQLQGVIYGTMTKKVTGLMSTMQYVVGSNVDFSSIMGSLMAVGFIILGMKMTHSLGMAAADGGVKLAQDTGKYMRSKAVEYGKRGAAPTVSRAGEALTQSKVPGLTALGRQMMRTGVKYRGAGLGKQMAEFNKSLEGMTAEERAEVFRSSVGYKRSVALANLTASGNIELVRDPAVSGNISARDLMALDEYNRSIAKPQETVKVLEAMDPKQLASFYSMLPDGSPLQDEAAMVIASKGKAGIAGIKADSVRDIAVRMMKKGRAKEAIKFAERFGLDKDMLFGDPDKGIPSALDELKSARASGVGVDVAEKKVRDLFQTRMGKMSTEDFKIFVQNAGAGLVDTKSPKFFGLGNEDAAVLSDQFMKFSEDDPETAVRGISPELDDAQRTQYYGEISDRRLSWANQQVRDLETELANRESSGTISKDKANDQKARISRMKDQIKNLDNARKSNDFQEFKKLASQSSTSPFPEFRELGRSMRV